MAGRRKRENANRRTSFSAFSQDIPAWLEEFAERYGLGAYPVRLLLQTQKYDNNIETSKQVRQLCGEIARLPSTRCVIDQEADCAAAEGKPRLCALPSAKESSSRAGSKAQNPDASLRDAAAGIHYDFAPVSTSTTT